MSHQEWLTGSEVDEAIKQKWRWSEKKSTLESKHLKYVIRFGVYSSADSLWICCRGLNNDLNVLGRSADWTLEELKFIFK